MATNSQNYFEYNTETSYTFTLIGGELEMMSFSDDDLQPMLGGDVHEAVRNIPDDRPSEEFELDGGNHKHEENLNIMDLIEEEVLGGSHYNHSDIIEDEDNYDINDMLGGNEDGIIENNISDEEEDMSESDLNSMLGGNSDNEDDDNKVDNGELAELFDDKDDFGDINNLLGGDEDESSSDDEDDLMVLGGFGKVF